MGQFIFHCNINYLNYVKKRRIFFREDEWWYRLEGENSEIAIVLHLHEKDELPFIEIGEESREEIIGIFLKSVIPSKEIPVKSVEDGHPMQVSSQTESKFWPCFEQIYAIEAKREEDFQIIEGFAKNANRLVLIHPEEEYADILRWRLLWDTGLIIEQYSKAHFFPSGQKSVLILSFSDGEEFKIPYRKIPEGSFFLEIGLRENNKRGIFQKTTGVSYHSLYGFLDIMLKNRYNSLVNMGKLNQFQIKIKNKFKKEKESLWKQRKTF